ncbi:hypothetical protein BKA63DRAFT_581009 [Paraphoma chrysanthemicola]|nr:hypothetical protein BKA63DRAFT_581009 [Paraphoma chrysanthemicola]
MARKIKVDRRPEAVRKTWANIEDLNLAYEANLAHHANNIDHGFGTDRPALEPPLHDPVSFPDVPRLVSVTEERKYVASIEAKLSLAQAFIRKESELGLDPNRNPYKDPVAVELAKGPIMFTFRTQEAIRDLVTLRVKLYKLGEDQEKNEAELQIDMAQFLWAWRELRGVLVWLMPGPTEGERERRAEVVMTNVLGANIVDEEDGNRVEEVNVPDGAREVDAGEVSANGEVLESEAGLENLS